MRNEGVIRVEVFEALGPLTERSSRTCVPLFRTQPPEATQRPLWGLQCRRLGWAKGALGSMEGTERAGSEAGSGALPLLGPLLSQGERGETGPPGPAGFAGPPVSAPVDPCSQPLGSASSTPGTKGTLQPVGREGQSLNNREMVSSLLSCYISTRKQQSSGPALRPRWTHTHTYSLRVSGPFGRTTNIWLSPRPLLPPSRDRELMASQAPRVSKERPARKATLVPQGRRAPLELPGRR